MDWLAGTRSFMSRRPDCCWGCWAGVLKVPEMIQLLSSMLLWSIIRTGASTTPAQLLCSVAALVDFVLLVACSRAQQVVCDGARSSKPLFWGVLGRPLWGRVAWVEVEQPWYAALHPLVGVGEHVEVPSAGSVGREERVLGRRGLGRGLRSCGLFWLLDGYPWPASPSRLCLFFLGFLNRCFG
jgi:hypothetical protein